MGKYIYKKLIHLSFLLYKNTFLYNTRQFNHTRNYRTPCHNSNKKQFMIEGFIGFIDYIKLAKHVTWATHYFSASLSRHGRAMSASSLLKKTKGTACTWRNQLKGLHCQ